MAKSRNSDTQWVERFNSLKPLPKATVMKLKPGTWVRLKWMDGPDTVELLIEKPRSGAGDVSLRTWQPHTSECSSHAGHSQVVETLGMAVPPEVK